MEKRTVTVELPAITAKWLKWHLICPKTVSLAAPAENELQKQILLTILSSAIGGNHEPSNPHR